MAVRNRAHRPDAERCHRCGHEAHEGRTQTIRRPAHAGSRLKLRDVLGRLRLKGQPSSRTGENSPYGMIGGFEETSASFEARSAPRSYPTEADHGFTATMVASLVRDRLATAIIERVRANARM